MMYIGNCHLEKLEFLPDEIELAVTKSWCYSVISIMERMDLCEDLIYVVNNCIYSSEFKHDSSGYYSKYVTMSVSNIKKIISVCGGETLVYVLPYNYDQISNNFLCSKLGDLKFKIDTLMNLDDYEAVMNLIMSINDTYLKRLALVYMKYLYMIQTEKKIISFKNSRKKIINKINSILKESQDCF